MLKRAAWLTEEQRAQLLAIQALQQHCDLGALVGASEASVDALDPTRTGSPRGLSTNVFRSGLMSLPPPLGTDSFRAVDLNELKHMVNELRVSMDAAHEKAARPSSFLSTFFEKRNPPPRRFHNLLDS